MFEPAYGDRVRAWPVGIDTDAWAPTGVPKTTDVLIYDKVRWEHDAFEASLDRAGPRGAAPPRPDGGRTALRRATPLTISRRRSPRAGRPCSCASTRRKGWPTSRCSQPACRSSRGTEADPGRTRPTTLTASSYAPVSSVPYWDDRCGATFADAAGFEAGWDAFWDGVRSGAFAPRDYVMEHLTLEDAARAYVRHAHEAMAPA